MKEVNMEEVKCPICEHKAIITKTYDYERVKWYDCELCGYFSLESSTFDLFDFKTYNNRTKLIFAIRKLSNKKKSIKIENIDDLESIIKRVEFPESTQDKIDLIIRFIYENNKNRSGYAISDDNGVIFGIKNYDELDLIITLSEDKNHLRFDPKFASGGGLCQLGSEGISRYEDVLKNKNSQKNEETPKKKKKKNIESNIQNMFKNTSIVYRDKDNINGVMGVKDLAIELSKIIENLPIEQGRMIGIFGKWGRGKTFLMNETWKELENSTKIIKIDFHAWKYQDTPAIWAYLYEHFVEAYYKESSSWFTTQKRKFALNIKRFGAQEIIIFFLSFALSVYWMFFMPITQKINLTARIVNFIGVGTIIGLIILYSKFGKSAKDLFNKFYKKVSYSSLLGIQAEVQKEIKFLFSVWFKVTKKDKKKNAQTKDKKNLLFVDDIDRCDEKKIIQIIDSLRVMLEDCEISKKVIVVAAVDEKILKRAIANKYKSLQNSDNDIVVMKKIITEYIDKLFISAIKLGALTDDEMNDFLFELSKNDIKSVIENEIDTDSNSNNINFVSADTSKEKKDKSPNANNKIEKNLSTEELELLSNCIKDSSLETPRQIRIFYYRYFLAKNLLMIYYKRIEEENFWLKSKNTKNLISLIFLYSNPENSDKITEHKIAISKSKEQTIELDLLKDIDVSQIDYLILLRVLEIVIAY